LEFIFTEEGPFEISENKNLSKISSYTVCEMDFTHFKSEVLCILMHCDSISGTLNVAAIIQMHMQRCVQV